MPDSEFLIFSESFYIKRFKNKGYQYHLSRETKQSPPINTRESKKKRKERFNSLLNKNKWTRSELARYLGASRAWVSKVLNN
jgi:DNA invertase Pin-like site-specific DNA recombinase